MTKSAAPARKPAAPAKSSAPAKAAAAPAPRKTGMEFIGTFPIRRANDNKKNDAKKAQTGPFFPSGAYVVGARSTVLARAQAEEFEKTFLAKHTGDKITLKTIPANVDKDHSALGSTPSNMLKGVFTKELDAAMQAGTIQVSVHDMRDIPIDLPAGFVVAAALRREDPRDVLVTRSTYGAIQELPFKARVGTSSRRCIMQIRSLRSDLDIVPIWGSVAERLEKLEAGEVDAVILPWASLRRMNIAPRYYVSLQVEQILPGPCQGIVGVVAQTSDDNLMGKLRYIEDSEASWASRCERAFLQKLGGSWDSPVGAYAHRKGTQDPWILDTVIGDARTGEILRHREIGTSRCKPESLADKAFTGIIAKGARKFLPFT